MLNAAKKCFIYLSVAKYYLQTKQIYIGTYINCSATFRIFSFFEIYLFIYFVFLITVVLLQLFCVLYTYVRKFMIYIYNIYVCVHKSLLRNSQLELREKKKKGKEENHVCKKRERDEEC